MNTKKRKGTDPNLIAKPFTYNELVSYQEGSIVSRTIMDKDEGTITLFAFAEGQRLSTHSAPFDALVQIIEGNGIITIEDKEFEVKAGQQIIMPANKPHGVTAKEPFKMVLVMIRTL